MSKVPPDYEELKKVVEGRRLPITTGTLAPIGQLLGINDEGYYLLTDEGWIPVTVQEGENGAVVYAQRVLTQDESSTRVEGGSLL